MNKECAVPILVALLAIGVESGCAGEGGEFVGLWYDESLKIPENTAMAATAPREEISRVSLEFPGLVCDHVEGVAVEGLTQAPIRQEDIELVSTVVTLRLPQNKPSEPHLKFFQREQQVGAFACRITPGHRLETFTALPYEKLTGSPASVTVFLRDHQELAEVREDKAITFSPQDKVRLWNGRELVPAVRADLVVETPGLYELRMNPYGLGWITQGGKPPQEAEMFLMEDPGKLGLMVSPLNDTPLTLELLRK